MMGAEVTPWPASVRADDDAAARRFIADRFATGWHFFTTDAKHAAARR